MNPNQDDKSMLYWQRACHLFDSSGYKDIHGSYFYHNRDLQVVKMGVGVGNLVTVEGDFLLQKNGNEEKRIYSKNSVNIFSLISDFLVRDTPYFFIVSPDINRRFVDTSIPKILFIQPKVEFTFSPEQIEGEISYVEDSNSRQEAINVLRDFNERPFSLSNIPSSSALRFSQVNGGWIAAESDENFQARLESSIDTLKEYPLGKMTLTRAYEYKISRKKDRFSIYKKHAYNNGEYACSHFYSFGQERYSLGCSPENKFEMRGRQLLVDIVAATCRSDASIEYVSRELTGDPKQVKEHRLSIVSRPKRFEKFCEPNSIHVVSEMKVKRLRNVYHLHSVAQGALLSNVTMFDLLDGVPFPVLGSNPKELVPLADTEMEPHRYYGGLVGHSDGKETGGCFLNIRNALINEEKLYAKVGVGIVAESNALKEIDETKDKISGLMEAVFLSDGNQDIYK